MYDNKIQNYINCVCKQVKWKNYRPAIRNEMQNHITDSTEALIGQGNSSTEAINKTLEELGDPQIIGEQLNKVYKPEYDRMTFCVSCLLVLLFCFLEYYVILEINGDKLWIANSLSKIFLGAVGAFAIFWNDWICKNKVNTFSFLVYSSVCLISIILYYLPISSRISVLNAVFLLFLFPFCCWSTRLKDKKIIGFVIILVTFSVPVVISLYMQIYASTVMLTLISSFIVTFILRFDWLNVRRKSIFYIITFAITLSIGVSMAAIKMENILININVFFIKEYIRESKIIGRGRLDIIGCKQLADYPIALLIARFGFWIAVIYFLFVSLILYGMVKTYRKQQSFLGRLIIAAIIFDWSVEIIFSLIVNLGIPLIGITVPLLDYSWNTVVKIIQLGLVKALDCFGNYIFSDYIDNKLFDIENGKIIIYYK